MSTTASERFKVTEKCENQTYRIALTHSSPSISLSLFACLYAVTQIDCEWVHRHSASGNVLSEKET